MGESVCYIVTISRQTVPEGSLTVNEDVTLDVWNNIIAIYLDT
jgi:hypothetical protein